MYYYNNILFDCSAAESIKQTTSDKTSHQRCFTASCNCVSNTRPHTKQNKTKIVALQNKSLTFVFSTPRTVTINMPTCRPHVNWSEIVRETDVAHRLFSDEDFGRVKKFSDRFLSVRKTVI